MLRQKATRLFNEQCAIAILANLPDRLNSRERQDEIDGIAEKTKKDLMLFVEVLQANVQEMRGQLGITVDQKYLLALLDHIQRSTKPNYACYVLFWRLSEWISKYDHMGIDLTGGRSIDPHRRGLQWI